MDNLLIKYFQQRMSKEELPSFNTKEAGPVITINREYGCPGKIIAQSLVEKVNLLKSVHWKWISKEILESLAQELKLQPSVIQDIKNFDERKTTDYLALLFTSDYYPGEKKIKNTISDIINGFAMEGNVVIVGRAGYQITNGIEKSLHISLKAPLEWRIEHICQRMNLSFIDGMRIVEEMSEKRNHFLSHFNRPGLREFDFVFDCSQTSNEEIIDVIVLEMKKMKWI